MSLPHIIGFIVTFTTFVLTIIDVATNAKNGKMLKKILQDNSAMKKILEEYERSIKK